MPAKSHKKRRRTVPLLRRLEKHFRCDSAKLPVVSHSVRLHDRPKLHLAIEELLQQPGRKAELIGIQTADEHRSPSLGRLASPESARRFQPGSVEYVDVSLWEGRHLACVKSGLYLMREDDQPIAILVSTPVYSHPPRVQIEIMADDPERAERVLHELQRFIAKGRAYRGHVLSLEQDCYGTTQINYHSLPGIRRDDLILPPALLDRIERQTLTFSKQARRLQAAGRHLKRGILLYGPPGTGKTLTAMYLVSQMPGRTVMLVTGKGVKSIEAACRFARVLEPATIVLEDVDLIGTERDEQEVGANALLFELLNQMDGLADDVDILFVLTTNRPDVLEPALAARPGRIDLAIEIPPPDAECRRRLFDLYGRGMQVEVDDWSHLLERTAGVTGAFIRELLRKAAVYAAEENGSDPLAVRDSHLNEALTELLVAGGPLTKSLLGVGREAGQKVDGVQSKA